MTASRPVHRWRAALLALLMLGALAAGCVDLRVAHVPPRLLEGPGGNGWVRNTTASQEEPTSRSAGLTKIQGLAYEDRAADRRGYPGSLSLTTARTVLAPSDESLAEDVRVNVRDRAEASGIRVESEGESGSRTLANGASSVYFVYNGSVTRADGFFNRNAKVKILGEVWQCRGERTSVVAVALAQVTSARSLSGVPISSNPDSTTWREIVADPSGSIEGVRGSNGLVHSVVCS